MPNIRSVLNQINEWDDVAGELYARGITGHRNSGQSCVLAKYIRETADPVDQLDVDSVVMWVEDGALQIVDMTLFVDEFIRDFDAGHHPELEA